MDPTDPTDPPAFTSTQVLSSLQSKEQLELLNEIDKLRNHGVNEFVSLPQLGTKPCIRFPALQVLCANITQVVCGDQSSGKSSVLEAITEIPFPRATNLCTRFATQIVLRRDARSEARVRIIPDSQRAPAVKLVLEAFSAVITDFTQLPEVVERAKAVMGLDAPGEGAFSSDTLTIEVSGPDKPQLTIVDLPGLIHTENKMQTKADVALVSELVRRYMADQRTIILAVVTAKNDYANQIVLKRAIEVDPQGLRTLGIITKPDTLPVGSAAESEYVALARNMDIYFKLGWHVLRNRNYEERSNTFEERNQLEATFFSHGTWNLADTGIKSLRARLSNLLLNHIKKELPRVHQEIITALTECEQELKLLGQSRATPKDQRMLLFKVSEIFSHLCKSAVIGNYDHPFFGLGEETDVDGPQRRLRAKIQVLNVAFAKRMRTRGHWREIVDSAPADTTPDKVASSSRHHHPEIITRAQAVSWVKPILIGGRGCELPGTYNPLLIGELFWAQSKNWEKLAKAHVIKVFDMCSEFLKAALKGLAPTDVMDLIYSQHIDTQMEQRLESANKELDKLLKDRRRHAITYNHYYTENVQKIRDRRIKERYEAVFDDALSLQGGLMNKAQIMAVLTAPRGGADMDNHACEEILDCMMAFYKVAYKTFVDNVAIVVVERCLLDELWDVFSPLKVMEMDEELVRSICEEAPEDLRRRELLEGKRGSLRGGLEVCGRALKGVRKGASGASLTLCGV